MRKTSKKIAPIVVTAAVLAYMVPLVLLVLWMMGSAAREGSGGAWLFLLLYLFLGGAVIVGIIKALLQRLDEIDGGEEEEASQY